MVVVLLLVVAGMVVVVMVGILRGRKECMREEMKRR